jgi:copper(I)-binding protein
MRDWQVLVTCAVLAGSGLLTAAEAGEVRAGALVIENPWARATPPGAMVGAAYLVIRNTGTSGDRLVGASTPVAATVEIHETRMTDGEMQMRPVEALEIPPGGSVRLQPGGLHLMLMDLGAPLVTGARVPLTLQFAGAGEVRVELAVAPAGSPGPAPR